MKLDRRSAPTAQPNARPLIMFNGRTPLLYDAAMNILGDWKWYAALAVFALFTAFVICLPGPQAKSVTPVAPPAPVASQAELPPGRPEPTADERESMLQYTVQEGDTVSGIARLFVITEEDLRWANNISEGGEFAPGDSIWIPVP